MSLQWIRKTYGVPAIRGGLVEYTGDGFAQQGIIRSARSGYLRVQFGEGHCPLTLHPTWEIRYLDASTEGAGAKP